MLARTTIAVFCEVNFVDLYRGAPLFGDLDSFMRKKGFLLAGLVPMNFGYKRIPRKFRGLGVPLQGEALYLMKPEKIKNEAVKLSLSINVLESNTIQNFLRMFYQEIERSPNLPPLWHDSLGIKDSISKQGKGGGKSFRLINRIKADPKLFMKDLERFFSNHIIKSLMFLKLYKIGFNNFEVFLSSYGFDRAAKEVFIRRIR